MRARGSSEFLKFLLTLSLMGNAAAGGYWLWLHKGPARAEALVQAPSPSSARIRLEGGPYAYSLRIRSLDAKAGEGAARGDEAEGGQDTPESLLGPPPGSSREVLALPDTVGRGEAVGVTQQVLQADETFRAAPANLRTGCCRIALVLEANAGGNRLTAVTPVSGTYHESFDPVAERQWEGDRLALWRYQTADGHGGKFHYEVYVERKTRG